MLFSNAEHDTNHILQPREKRHLIATCALSLLLGALYICFVRAGLPYDEPAHWNIVRHYARGDFLPIMGTRGVSYEAYQAPLFYVCGGALTFLTSVGGERFAFLTLRFASLLLMIPTILLSYHLARRVFGRHGEALLVALFVALNPALLAIFSSVQNDAPAIVLSLLILHVTIRFLDDTTTSTRCALISGVLSGAAILFKLTTAFAFFAVLISVAVFKRDARQFARFFALYASVVFVITFWWFARNLALYNDFSGSAAMQKFFPEGAGKPLNLLQMGSWKMLAQNVVTYLWSPTEYFRNLVELPRLAKLFIATLTTTAFIGGLMLLATRLHETQLHQTQLHQTQLRQTQLRQTQLRANETARRAALIIALFYAVCLTIYLRTVATQWFFPARMTLVCLIAPALLIVGGNLHLLRRIRVLDAHATRIVGAILIGVLLLINFAVLRGVSQLPPMPFDMKFAARNSVEVR